MSSQNNDFAELSRWYAATGHAHISLLRWYRTVGYARFEGVGVDMTEPPAIDGSDIEYLGGHSGKIDGRDMTPDEVTQARELLAKMMQGARDGLSGQSTIVVIINDQEPAHDKRCGCTGGLAMTPDELRAAGVQLEQTDAVELLVGYLVTHADGYEARIGPDKTRAELYAARNHATIEPMFVKRPADPSGFSG